MNIKYTSAGYSYFVYAARGAVMLLKSKLWYQHPAKTWNEALPIGNGRMGAMVFGEITSERVQFNEDSIWSGGYRNRNNPGAKQELKQIRKLLRNGKVKEAEKLSQYALSGTPEFQRTYQTLGDLLIVFDDIPNEIADYQRYLSLDEAVAITKFTANGYLYKREVLASNPADIIAMKLSTDNPAGLSFSARLVRNRFCENTGKLGDNGVYLTGSNGGADGITFHWVMTGHSADGEPDVIGEYIIFKNAKEAVLYITASSSFRFENTLGECIKIIQKAECETYDILRQKHVEDYKSLENRVTFSLDYDNKDIPTDQRLQKLKDGEFDNCLIALYFRYGRYLLISGSRRDTLPLNLQGIWCEDFLPAWDSKYTININTQMNYWHAEICNLPECHEPLFEHIRRMHSKGSVTARDMYGARGFVAHHNTDIWGDTAPQDTWIPSTYWVLGAAWLCLHIWEHYEYSLDDEFLLMHFDLLKDACLFFVDFLIENERDYLVISPSVSPENTYILSDGTHGTLCEGCAMDGQILTELFNVCIRTCEILNRDLHFSDTLKRLIKKLPPIKIGKNGGIMEWLYDWDEAEPGHRHMSHLFALFPGNGISVETTPDLAEAARRTLEMRLKHGGGHTGWSRAWIINFWTRLGDGRKAYFHLNELLRHSTLPNLFDDHPPFQIDGNFGATAAIAHMLLQSDSSNIYILKALPDEWKKGTISGLKAKGNLMISIKWEDGLLKEVRIAATKAYKGNVIYNRESKFIDLDENEVIVLDERLEIPAF